MKTIIIAILVILLILLLIKYSSKSTSVSGFYPGTQNGLATSYDIWPDIGGSIFSTP